MNYQDAYRWLHGDSRIEYCGCRDAAEVMNDVNKELLEALEDVHKLIIEGAEHGFNYAVGDWAERLFRSNYKTCQAISKAKGE